MKFSERLLNAIQFRETSAKELAEKTGISRSLISKYLHNKSVPNQVNIGLIAKFLNVSPSYLIGITDEMVLKQTDYASERIKTINEHLKMLNENQLTLIEYTVKTLREENERKIKKKK